MAKLTKRFEADWYRDAHGRRWFCAQPSGSDTIVCYSDDGYMTAADPATFALFAWTAEGRAALNDSKEDGR